MANRREPALRVFAGEYNASRAELKGTEEMAPSFVITPLGAKVNRVYVVGVLTEVEAVGETDGYYRARLSDPTGVHTLYSGQYQPEATQALTEINPPAYVAVVGKARTYEPEPGQLYVSIRPESITPVDEDTRNAWVLEASQHTLARIEAMRHVASLESPTPEDLERLGVDPWMVEGTMLAAEKYQGDVDLGFYQRMVQESLAFLKSGEMIPPRPVAAAQSNGDGTLTASAPVTGPGEEVEEKVLGIITGFATSDEKGAQWDNIVAEGEKSELDENVIEEAINALMDKGVIYEPILGRLKVT